MEEVTLGLDNCNKLLKRGQMQNNEYLEFRFLIFALKSSVRHTFSWLSVDGFGSDLENYLPHHLLTVQPYFTQICLHRWGLYVHLCI